jgi:hypothetical protein
MLRRQIEECQHDVSVLGQAVDGFRIFGTVIVNPDGEGRIRRRPDGGVPDFPEIVYAGLHRFGRLVEDVGKSALPAPLVAG